MSASTPIVVPKAFVFRRVDSLMGLWLVIYLAEHLLTNSQAALWIGDDGAGFVRMVNFIQHLPYLQVVEIVLIGMPIAIHGIWGIKYLFTSKANSYASDGSKPALSVYERNRAYTWQRITSWILLVGIVFHVVQMRFLDKPEKSFLDNEEIYLVKLNFDSGLYTLSARLHVTLYSYDEVEKMKNSKPLSSKKCQTLKRKDLTLKRRK